MKGRGGLVRVLAAGTEILSPAGDWIFLYVSVGSAMSGASSDKSRVASVPSACSSRERASRPALGPRPGWEMMEQAEAEATQC